MLSMTSGFARAWLTWNVCAGDAQSVKALSMVKASSEAGGSGGDSSLVILCRKCEDHEFGASYRVRTCKYCRSTSWSKSPLAPGPTTTLVQWQARLTNHLVKSANCVLSYLDVHYLFQRPWLWYIIQLMTLKRISTPTLIAVG